MRYVTVSVITSALLLICGCSPRHVAEVPRNVTGVDDYIEHLGDEGFAGAILVDTGGR